VTLVAVAGALAAEAMGTVVILAKAQSAAAEVVSSRFDIDGSLKKRTAP